LELENLALVTSYIFFVANGQFGPDGSAANFENGDGGGPARNWAEISGRQIEQLIDEPIRAFGA
jgi:hypothetical protein